MPASISSEREGGKSEKTAQEQQKGARPEGTSASLSVLHPNYTSSLLISQSLQSYQNSSCLCLSKNVAITASLITQYLDRKFHCKTGRRRNMERW